MDKVICIPILSLTILFHLKYKKGSRNYTVFYELFPRYIRAIMRLFSISESQMSNYFRFLTGYEIKKLPHGDKLIGYNNIRMNVYIKIVDVCENFIPEIKNDPWFPSLQKLINNSASIATSIKFLAHYQMHLYLLSAKLCQQANIKNSNENILLIGPAYWPNELYMIIKQDEDFIGIDFYQLPKFFKARNKVSSLYKLTIVLITAIFKQGITLKKIGKENFQVASELFDPEKLGGSPFDVDFFVDNKTVTYSDSLFYVIAKNNRLLKNNGYGTKKLKQLSDKKKIPIIKLKNYPYNSKTIYNLLLWYIKVIAKFFVLKGSIVWNLMPYMLREHLNYLPLFLHFNLKHHIHFMTPNGRAPLSLNSGVITDLCRKNKVHSNGIQNRIIDARQYEFCFDCYDTNFAWGQAWIDVLGTTSCFIDNQIITGIFNLTELEFKEAAIKSQSKSKEFNVIIFPTDVNINPSAFEGSFYPISYTIDFLLSCIHLAKSNPQINFYCKLKDESHLQLIKENIDFINSNAHEYKNFKFVQRSRTRYLDLLLNAHLAISIGFTSPGLDAILLNKKSIYYSQLKNAGIAFKQIPDFVVESKNDLISNFSNQMNVNSTSDNTSVSLDTLDPFRDGLAIKKIIKHLS
jgi:hypothetical protein